MQDCLELFPDCGPPRAVAGNTPLPLDDPAGLWLVAAGAVDVFAVPPPRDGVPGARVLLCRVAAGQLLLGGLGGTLAVGGPGTGVVRLDRGRFEGLAREPDHAGRLAALVDGWVEALTAGVVGGRPPRRAALLELGREVRLAEGAAAGLAAGVLWVRHEAGSSRLLGAIEPPLGPGGPPFPLANPGWLVVAEPDTRLSVAVTEVLLGEAELWPGLARFHQAILSCVADNLAAAEAAERDRLRRRAESERRLLWTTVARLADVAGPGGEEELDGPTGPGPTPEEDPLLAACRLVGARLGVAVRAPLEVGTARRRSDPISAIARASRLRVRRVRLAEDWWRHDHGPLLAFLAADERPVALLPLSPTRYELADPAGARASVPAGGVAVLPFGYSFYRPFPARPLGPWGLFRFGVTGSWRDWLAVLLLGLAGSLLGLFTPIVTGWVFDSLIPSADRRELLLVALALLVSSLSAALFQFTRGIAVLRLEARADGTVQAALWDRLLNLPATFFRRYTAGDLAQRAMGIAAIRQVLTDVALSVLLSFVFSLVWFALLFWYDARLAGVACAVFAAALLATGLSAWRQLHFQRAVYQVRGRIAGRVLQLITGIARLRLAGAEDRALAVWGREFGVQRRLTFRARSAANLLAAFNAALPAVALLALFAAVSLRPRDALSLGAFLAFSAAFGQILAAAIDLGSAVGYAVQVVPLYERARPILEATPEVAPAAAIPGDLSGDIELSHVSFRYQPDGPLVLDDLSLHIRAGEFVAFVGPSGAGKSTIIRLLLGFEAPSAGSIYYDHADLAGLDRQAVRRQTGVVLQDGKLMAGDLFSNIIGSSLLTLEDAWEAARLAGLAGDIRAMPMGMQTVVSEGGSTLSGGQRQRLMIARAVVSKPRILLFDEATSALDNETQAQVSHSLERLRATRVVVAHRLSTVEAADRIVVLEGGRVVQTGRYEDLIARPGLFAELARRQLA